MKSAGVRARVEASHEGAVGGSSIDVPARECADAPGIMTCCRP